jgi:mRNA-degrading endonuclease RelE of RelBE toxin-antitoxin system
VIREVLFLLLFFSNLCFAAIMTQDSGKSIAENDTKLTDPKVFMEAMMSEMRRVMKMEMEQIHERIDQMENRREEQPQNGRNLRRRGKEFHRGRRMKSVMGLVLMKKKIGSPLLTLRDLEEDLEKLGITKITTWVVLR